MPCSNAAKTRNPLKFAGVPKNRQQIPAVNGPKFAILWERVEDILPLNKFLANSLHAIASPSVVCLTVTSVHPTQEVEIFGNISTPFGTLAIR